MSLPVPLGVRFYGITLAAERWVTRWVDDISFRSVIPGGFASATITLRVPRDAGPLSRPDPLGFSQLTDLFSRVQVVDLRTLEVAWEGRIEDPARQVEPDTWQIGALGSMVVATDIQRPMWYIDSSLTDWFSVNPFEPEFWEVERDDEARVLRSTIKAVSYDPSDSWELWRWTSDGYDADIGRFTTTHDATVSGSGWTGAEANGVRFSVTIESAGLISIDATGFESAEATKTNLRGTDFTINTRKIGFRVRRDADAPVGTFEVSPNVNRTAYTTLRNTSAQVLRLDRSGNAKTSASDYTHGDYVTVAMVVEDVLGRFLVGGWYAGGLNTPYPGSVRSTDAYIDTTDTTQILHLTYPEGATAADILNDMMTKVQENAYWAIWESKWGASNADADFPANSGFRFEWATWPNNWGYLASSQDGLESQPNGDDVYNFISFRYPDSSDTDRPHVLTSWVGATMNRELYQGGFTRAITVNKEDTTSAATAGTLRDAVLATKNKVLNAGTLTVKRRIPFYDAGSNSGSGAGRWVDPWMIRPGKLIRISDLPPRAYESGVSFGTTLPSTTIDGTIFRVVATEYSSSDNSCRLELDQVSRWSTPTQITAGAAGASKSIRIQ